jgi:regulator of sigma E protease
MFDSLTHLLGYAAPFLVILTVLVFFHELGHYAVARYNGVKVETFSIGFGPELFGWNDRAGTRWRISAVPLGGYVKMFGDSDAASTGAGARNDLTESEKSVSFHHKTVGQRAAIVAAGPIANFILAIVLLAGLYAISGQPYTPATIDTIQPDSAAQRAGLQSGDLVRAIDGQSIERFEELQRYVQARPGETLTLSVERAGAAISVPITPTLRETKDRAGNIQRLGVLGVTSTQTRVVRHDPATAVWQATRETYSLTMTTLKGVGQMISGARSSDEVGGVLRIAQMSGEVSKQSFGQTIFFLALLSINLGLINLFPIPVLDGGHLVFYAFEVLAGRPLSQKMQEWGSMAGLAAVVSLMLFATWNDLVHLRVVAYITSLLG